VGVAEIVTVLRKWLKLSSYIVRFSFSLNTVRCWRRPQRRIGRRDFSEMLRSETRAFVRNVNEVPIALSTFIVRFGWISVFI
jgi:hypothetical protein